MINTRLTLIARMHVDCFYLFDKVGYMTVRLKIKEIAKEKKISQRKLFLRSGVDLRTIQRIWRDKHTNITLDTLGRLAYALGVDSSELIEGVAEVPDYIREIPTQDSPEETGSKPG